MPGWWDWVVVAIALIGPLLVAHRIGVRKCPNCGYGHVRNKHRTRLSWVGFFFFVMGIIGIAWWSPLLATVGALMIAVSPADEAILRCPACTWASPARIRVHMGKAS